MRTITKEKQKKRIVFPDRGNRLALALSPWAAAWLAVVLLVMVWGSYSYLGQVADLRLFLPEMVFFSALVICCLVVLCYLQVPLALRWLLPLIFIAAVLVRMLFILRPAELSDDLFRYLWDGLQLCSGHNPYALAPQQVVATTSSELVLQPLINHANLITIYPPAAQLLFALSGGTVMGLKLLLLIFDMSSCAILAMLLARLGRSQWWLILYAWHPLVILEGAASAHIDIAAVFFVLCSLWLVTSPAAVQRSWLRVLSAILLCIAIMVKLFPLLFVPFFCLVLPVRQRWWFYAIVLITCGVLIVPFMPQIANAVATLRLYISSWEFSSFSFRLLRTIFNSGAHARLLLLTLFGCIVVSQWWNLQQIEVTTPRLITTCCRFLLVFLLLTPTLHPWYALYLVAFIPLSATPATIVLSWSVLLSYQVVAVQYLDGVWLESSLISFYVWLAPVAALLASAAVFLRRKRSHRRRVNG